MGGRFVPRGERPRRFAELLNAGAFTFEPIDRNHAQYARALFVVTGGGESLGGVLVAERLAQGWRGFRAGVVFGS